MLDQPLLCSVRFIQPILDLVMKHLGSAPENARRLADAAEPRILVTRAHDLIADWTQATGDEDLGLRAGTRACIGSYGPFDYALHTAPTLRASFELAQRYARVLSQALDISLAQTGERASLRFVSVPHAPRALNDLLMSSWYRCHVTPHLDAEGEIECHFTYSEPASLQRHRAIFREAKLTFEAAFNGITFDARTLDTTLASADTSLHQIHCDRLSLLEAGVQPPSFTLRVQRVLPIELALGRATSTTLARRFRMSRRTLARSLAAEGTTYTRVLDEVRRSLAVRLMHASSLSLTEIATRVGFTHVQAFHRAFKRWTGSSPKSYRKEHRDLATQATSTSVAAVASATE